MNNKIRLLTALCLIVIFGSCSLLEYDNYDSPKSQLHGKLVYQGEPIHVRSNSVTFQLWQSGFGLMTPINVTVDQDGSYSAMLFDGDYKLIIPQGQGPFISVANTDSIAVEVNGDTQLNIEVTPFYLIKELNFSIKNRTVSATCSLQQIITGEKAKDIGFVALYVSETNFVNSNTSISSHRVNGTDIKKNSITFSAEVPELTPSQEFVYARIGVKMNNVEDMLFSAVEKIQLN